jgi:hypothetical protein
VSSTDQRQQRPLTNVTIDNQPAEGECSALTAATVSVVQQACTIARSYSTNEWSTLLRDLHWIIALMLISVSCAVVAVVHANAVHLQDGDS